MSAKSSAYDSARQRLCDEMLQQGVLTQPRVAEAFLKVPREAFVPPASPSDVYADTTIPVCGADGQWLTTSSQPGMMAIMLDQLDVQPGHNVLEIGTGTGYNTAILEHLVRPDGRVCSVEYESEAAQSAAAALGKTGYAAEVHTGDGAEGWPDGAPYDRILSTVAIWDLPGPWEAQATQDARIVAPVTVLGAEYSLALEREGEGWISHRFAPCAFVRFKGRMQHPDTHLTFGEPDHPSLILRSEPGQLPPRDLVSGWLVKGQGTGAALIEQRADWESFVLYLLAVQGPGHTVRAVSGGAGLGWTGPAVGFWDEEGLSLLSLAGRIVRFGTGNASALHQIVDAWQRDGSPATAFRFRFTPGVEPPGPGVLPRWTHTLRVEPSN